MSYIFVQDSGFMYLIPSKETLVNIFDNETFELYRVDNRSEGSIDTPEYFKELIEADNNDVGFDIGNILDIDLETLEEAVYVKKYGLTTEELSASKGVVLRPYEDSVTQCDGFYYSYSVDRWFPKYSDMDRTKMFDRIMERNNEY